MRSQQKKLALRRELELKLARLNVDFLTDEPEHNIKAYVTRIIDIVERDDTLSIEISKIRDFPKNYDNIFINILKGTTVDRPSSGMWLDSQSVDSHGQHLSQHNCLINRLLGVGDVYGNK